MNLILTQEDAQLLYDTLMQLPNQSNTYPLLVKLVGVMRDAANQPTEAPFTDVEID